MAGPLVSLSLKYQGSVIQEMIGKLRNPLPLYRAIGLYQAGQIVKTHFDNAAMQDLGPDAKGRPLKGGHHRNVLSRVNGDRIEIFTNDQALAHNALGGEILPKNKQWLTLPAKGTSKSKRASSFTLKFALNKDHKDKYGFPTARLFEPGPGGKVRFWLHKKVVTPMRNPFTVSPEEMQHIEDMERRWIEGGQVV